MIFVSASYNLARLVCMDEMAVCETHSINVPLFAALHVFSKSLSLFLGDRQSLPQLHYTATVGQTHCLNLSLPILQLKI